MNMPKIIRLTTVISAVGVLALTIAACGGDDATSTESEATQMLSLNGDQTVLALDPGTAKVLAENKVKVAPVDPASAGDEGISFPITGGEVDSETLAGTIDHSGGLEFSAGKTNVALTDFVVDTAAGTLTATTPDGAKLVTLDLDLAGLDRAEEEDGTIVASGIVASLTKDAAAALNDAFSVDLFKGGLTIGDVTITATAD
jgi:hypothetical protein